MNGPLAADDTTMMRSAAATSAPTSPAAAARRQRGEGQGGLRRMGYCAEGPVVNPSSQQLYPPLPQGREQNKARQEGQASGRGGPGDAPQCAQGPQRRGSLLLLRPALQTLPHCHSSPLQRCCPWRCCPCSTCPQAHPKGCPTPPRCSQPCARRRRWTAAPAAWGAAARGVGRRH